VTSGSPGNASTVYGPTSDASTVYGPTSNVSAVYGATTNASTIYGSSSGASAIYGPTSNASAVYGATTNASAVYGPTSHSSTVYGPTSNASAVYGATTNASAVYGPTSHSSTVYGPTRNDSTVYGATTNASALYGATNNASAVYGPTSNASAVYGTISSASAIYGPASNASTVYGATSNASTVYGPTGNASTNYAGDINSEITSWIAYGPTAASAKVATENARAVDDLTTQYQGLKVAQDAYGSAAYKTTAQVDGLTQKLEDQFKTIADGVSAYSPSGGGLAANYNSATYDSSSNYAGDINNEIANWISYGSSPSSGTGAAGAVAQSTAVTTANARAVEELATQYKGLKATQDSYGNTADKNKSQVDSLTTELEDQFKALSSVTSAYDRAGNAAHTINNYNTSTNYNASNYAGDINNEIANWSSYGNSSTSMPTSTSTTYAGGGYYNYDATGSAIYSGGTFSAPSAGSMSAYRSPGSGGFSMPGFGGGGSGMGSFELPSWLGGGSIAELMAATPFASAAPAGGFASIEALMASGQAGPSAGWAAGGLGGAVQGLSVGSMLGAGVGIGMGAYSLATSKNTAQTLGGIGQMIGGGMMLIPGMQIPGMVVSALSAILPGMLGGEEYKWPPLAGANVQFNPGAGGYSPSETQQLGGRAIGGQYANVPGTIDALFAATGGTVTPGMAMSGAIWNNQREGTTSTYVISPTQGSLQLSEGSGDQSAAVDRMIAKIFYMTATTPGALTGISPTLSTALGNKEPTSTAQVAAVIGLVKTYDELGKETTEAETALKAIDDSFASLTAGAREYGLSLAPIEVEQKKQHTKYGQDFVDNIESMFDPLGIALKKLGVEREAGLREAQYIADNVKDVYVDMAKVAEYYTRKEAQLREQFYGGAVASLEQVIQRLTFGDLSNSSPATQLDAIGATFIATRAQAAAGDSSAIQRIAGEGTTYAEAARSYFASSPEYDVIKTEIRQSLAEVQAAIQIPTSGTPLNMNDPAMQNMLAANEQLRQVVQMQSDQMQNLQNMVAGLTAQLQRVAVAGR